MPRERSARDHQHREVATAAERKRVQRILNAFLVPRHVLEGAPDGPRHIDEQIVGVGGAAAVR